MTLKPNIAAALTATEQGYLTRDLEELSGFLLDSNARFLVTRICDVLATRTPPVEPEEPL